MVMFSEKKKNLIVDVRMNNHCWFECAYGEVKGFSHSTDKKKKKTQTQICCTDGTRHWTNSAKSDSWRLF